MQRHSVLTLAILAALSISAPTYAQTANAQSVEELRNTLVSVMEALVQKGVLTHEQAQQIVANAQAKTEAEAKAKSAQDVAEKDAVRVTYVPENVKTEIGNQVVAQIEPGVVNAVIAQAKREKWGVPGALPDWLSNLSLYGDVRVRVEQDSYGSDNGKIYHSDTGVTDDRRGSYLNYDATNSSGKQTLLNVTEDRFRMLARARLGLLADLGDSFKADIRLASGTPRNVGSTNLTLGAYNARSAVNLDKAALIWDYTSPTATTEIDIRAGRFANPYKVVSELVWDADLTFEGISTTYALDLFGRNDKQMERGLYLTLGAMPLQEVELSNKDKWLLGAQLGSEVPFGASSSVTLAAAYYEYTHMVGIQNQQNLALTNFTAPLYMQKGNSVFDITSSTGNTDPQIWALASEFKLLDANASLNFPALFGKRMTIGAEYVRNLAFDRAKILALTASNPSIYKLGGTGYDISLTLGDTTLKALGNWRVSVGYRYLESDAVVDAFTDSDFHLGGTGSKGYQIGLEAGLSRNTWLKARLMSATEAGTVGVDNVLPFGIDVYQLDFNGSF